LHKEIERKYKLSFKKAKSLISQAKKKAGILQWYDLFNNVRYRLQIVLEKSGFGYIWIKTIKRSTSNSEIRYEHEEILNPRELSISDFEDLPFVLKVRYFLKDDPEVVIDEFLTDMHRQQLPDTRYFLEMELKSSEDCKHFVSLEKEYKLTKIQNVTANRKYKNGSIATRKEIDFRRKHNKELKEIKMTDYVRYVENYLKML
jgi:hypothetical protein